MTDMKYLDRDLFIATEKLPNAEHNRFRQEWIGTGKKYKEISQPGSFYRVHGIKEEHDPHGKNFPDKHLDYDIEKGYLLHYRKQDSNKN
jgi:hypothetical protein